MSSPDFRDEKYMILTRNNVQRAVRNATNTDWLGNYLGVPSRRRREIQKQFSSDREQRVKKYVDYFMDNDPLASWRRVIVALDTMRVYGGTVVADKIRHLAEPITDPTLTINNLHYVTSSVKDWYRLGRYDYSLPGLSVPVPVLDEIRANPSMTEEDKKTKVLLYFLSNSPMASWEKVAGALYSMEEKRALEAVKEFLTVTRDPSLTPENLSTVLDIMSDSLWWRFGAFVNIPDSELDRIRGQCTSDRECKQALIHTFLSSHPAPSWTLVAWALYITEWWGEDGDGDKESSCLRALNHLQELLPTVSGKSPDLRGVEIVEKTKIEVDPEQPLDYLWEGRGFKVHIPAGAMTTTEPVTSVTATVRASLSGEYELPEDTVLVSGVYGLSLDPPVERFTEKVTLTLQHCAPDDDSALTFITSTQDEPPYTFQPLPGGSFSESGYGTIDVQHFSPIGVIARRKMYAFCTYYIPLEKPNTHEVRITVTPNLKLHLKAVHNEYQGREKGHEIQAYLNEESVSLNIQQPEVGIPEKPWENDGWKLTPLTCPTLQKRCLEGYKPGRSIPYFAIRLQGVSPDTSLVQKVGFTGIETANFLSILKEPGVLSSQLPVSPASTTTTTSILDRSISQPPLSPSSSSITASSTAGLVSMRALVKLSTSTRDIRILDESAEKYQDIGTILLNDDSGAIVRGIKETARDNTIKAVRMIYEQWLQEDEGHTWKKLIHCFRDVKLNSLARELELHFGLPSPSLGGEGRSAYSQTTTSRRRKCSECGCVCC